MPALLSTLLPIALMQAGPNPSEGGIPDYSFELQERPPRTAPLVESPEIYRPETALPIGDDGWLRNCLELVDSDPARAHVQAQLRRNQSSQDEQVIANYCLGMAASALELWSDAQAAFVAARDGTDAAEGRLKARFGTMAGNAAIAFGDTQAALGLLSTAHRDALIAGASEIAALAQIDRARLLVSLDRASEAEAALAEARKLAPQSVEAWLLSATLMRRMERLSEAQGHIERAAMLVPTSPEVALEAGVIAVLGGREDTARANWRSVIALAPDSAEADTARGYLAQLGDPVPLP